MTGKEKSVLLISNDATFCGALRTNVESRMRNVRVAAVSGVESAERILREAVPCAIVLEESGVLVEHEGGEMAEFSRAAAELSHYAPVLAIAEIGLGVALSARAPDSRVGFVARSDNVFPVISEWIRNQMRNSEGGKRAVAHPTVSQEPNHGSEAFGEVLRHELNNPLTGILGNAELLLAEVRRMNDGTMPHGGKKRLETIAELAVRMRETVRCLSEDWEEGRHAAP